MCNLDNIKELMKTNLYTIFIQKIPNLKDIDYRDYGNYYLLNISNMPNGSNIIDMFYKNKLPFVISFNRYDDSQVYQLFMYDSKEIERRWEPYYMNFMNIVDQSVEKCH